MKQPSTRTKLATVLSILLMGLIACQSDPNSTNNSPTTPDKTMPGQGVSVSSSASV